MQEGENWGNYGIDWEGPIPLDSDSDSDRVTVPETAFALEQDAYATLRSTNSPLRDDGHYGIETYLESGILDNNIV